jgi:hypothetical protein
MSTADVIVEVGSQTIATVVQQDGLYAVVRLNTQLASEPIITCIRIGAIDPIPGFEATAAELLQNRLATGSKVKLVWLGHDANGLAVAQVSDGAGSVERSLLAAGVAIPNPQGRAVATVAVSYQTSLVDASRANRGAWADETSGIAALTREWTASAHLVLRPTFVSAHPSFCLLIILLVSAMVSYVMYRENQALAAELDAARSGPLRRTATKIVSAHARFFRIDPFRPFRQRPAHQQPLKDPQDPPA